MDVDLYSWATIDGCGICYLCVLFGDAAVLSDYWMDNVWLQCCGHRNYVLWLPLDMKGFDHNEVHPLPPDVEVVVDPSPQTAT